MVGSVAGLLGANALFYLIVTSVTLSKGYAFEPAVLVQVFCLHSVLLALLVAISLLFSLYVSQGAAGTGAGIFVVLCYLFVPRIPNLLAYAEGWRAGALTILYFIAPHLELFDMRARVLHNWGPLGGGIFVGTLAYGLLLTTLFLGLAWLVFRRKYFKRGAQL